MTRNIFTSDCGYEVIREPGADAIESPRLYHHRLLAYAWGLIDDLDADVHVHHRIECAFVNTEGNLKITRPGEHSQITRQREKNRLEYPEENHPEIEEVFA